ncbi:hypothetical protein [Duganella sp. BuS-21]|uniref:hypothetical protein n=1 Tax=Duganella sp. BuS-21 TaxID=2943848 RepID=UPI0035A747D2
MAVENKAQIWAVMGQSGTGKGLWIKSELRRLKPKRILILDPQDEYGAFAQPVTSAAEMARVIAAAGADKPFAVRYVFPKSCTGDHFAKIFGLACRLAYGAANCAFLVEELSNFTTASWGPPLWRRMCNSGRHEGVWVIGCSQFPAQVDKAFLSNATMVHVGWLGEEPHRKAVATRMNISPELINELPDLHFLEWHRSDRRVVAGEVSIAGRVTERGPIEKETKNLPKRSPTQRKKA